MYCVFSPVQVHCTPHLDLPVDHIKLKQISCRGGCGGQEMGEQPGSCPAVGMSWQHGRQGQCQLAQQLSQLFFLSQPLTQRGRGWLWTQLLISPGLGRLPAMLCLILGSMEMRGRCCHQKWLWRIDAQGRWTVHIYLLYSFQCFSSPPTWQLNVITKWDINIYSFLPPLSTYELILYLIGTLQFLLDKWVANFSSAFLPSPLYFKPFLTFMH